MLRYSARSGALCLIVLGGCTGSMGGDETATAMSAVSYESSACKVVYTVTNQWGGGFGADIQVTNKLGTALAGWKLEWDWPSGQTITQAWNAAATQASAHVVATNVSYNGTVSAGGTVGFGFNGGLAGTNTAPVSFSLNGVSCSGTVGGSGGVSGSGGANGSGGRSGSGGVGAGGIQSGTGGAQTGAGGSTISSCKTVGGGQSGNFNTTGGFCFQTSDNIQGWGCSNMTGRTLTVNGVAVSCGAMPLPAKANGYYVFHASAGGVSYASVYWWGTPATGSGGAPTGAGGAVAGSGGSGSGGRGSGGSGSGGTGSGGAGTCTSATWNPPSNLVTGLDEVWSHSGATITAASNIKMYQIMAGKGSLNYCVRWDATTTLSATDRDQIEALIARCDKQWIDKLAGWGCWPYPNVTVKVSLWAVKNRALLAWDDSSTTAKVVVNSDASCPADCGPWDPRNPHSSCSTARYDEFFWLDGTVTSYTGWGSATGFMMGATTFLDAARRGASTETIVVHEMGHGHGLDDFYDWTPTGFSRFVMLAGSSSVVTDTDGWMLRDVWRHVRSKYGYPGP